MGFIRYKDEAGNWQEVLVIKGEPGAKGDAGEAGPKGDPGYTPQLGKDYFTEEDKAEIRGYVDEQMGDIDSALDSILAIENELIGGDTE